MIASCGESGSPQLTTAESPAPLETTSLPPSAVPTTATSSSTTTTTSTSSTTTTTTTQPPPTPEQIAGQDAQLIKKLWRDFSDSWFGGIDSGVRYLLDNNHPDMGISVESYLRCYGDYPEGYTEEHLLDTSTIERDDDWMMPDSPVAGDLAGKVPRGRLYIFRIDSVFSSPGAASSTRASEVHSAILDGSAYFFFPGC